MTRDFTMQNVRGMLHLINSECGTYDECDMRDGNPCLSCSLLVPALIFETYIEDADKALPLNKKDDIMFVDKDLYA